MPEGLRSTHSEQSGKNPERYGGSSDATRNFNVERCSYDRPAASSTRGGNEQVSDPQWQVETEIVTMIPTTFLGKGNSGDDSSDEEGFKGIEDSYPEKKVKLYLKWRILSGERCWG